MPSPPRVAERRVCRALPAARGGGEGVPCPDFASNTLAFALQLRKITENFSQGNRMGISLIRIGSFYSGRLVSSLLCHWMVGRAGRRGS